MIYRFPVLCRIGDKYIATCPKICKCTPIEGLIELKLSEFIAMKEAVEAAANEEKTQEEK